MCALMSNDNIETYSIANKEALGKLQEMTEDWISEEEYLAIHTTVELEGTLDWREVNQSWMTIHKN